MALNPEQVRAELTRLIDAGDETALEAFMLEHFEDLPKDAQGQLLFSYYADAIKARASDEKITDLQENALKALEALEKGEQ